MAVLFVIAVACGTGSGDRKPAATTAVPRGTVTAIATAVAPVTRSVLTGAESSEKQSPTIRIAAASDLRAAMTDHQAEVESSCKTKITWVFGSSGTLSTQIAAGADFGLLLSADIQYPADLAKQGLLVPNGMASYGVGRIVVATRAGLEPVTKLSDLSRADIKKIAIANPDHAPYGRAAQQALESAGVWDAIKSRLVFGENIRQTTDYVAQGNADAGIVALALVVNGSPAQWKLIDSTMHKPIEQGGGVVKGTGAELTGRCVLQFMLDSAGQAILKKYGFEPVPA